MLKSHKRASHQVGSSSQLDDGFYSSASSWSSAHTLSILTSLLLLWRSAEGGRATRITGALLTWHHVPHCGKGWERQTQSESIYSHKSQKYLWKKLITQVLNNQWRESGKLPWRNIQIHASKQKTNKIAIIIIYIIIVVVDIIITIIIHV